MNLLDKATKEPENKHKGGGRKKWSHIVPAALVLREKGYTAKDTCNWLKKEAGIECTPADLYQACSRYK